MLDFEEKGSKSQYIVSTIYVKFISLYVQFLLSRTGQIHVLS